MEDYSDLITTGCVVLAIWWLISAFAVGTAAKSRGRSSGSWFAMSFFFGPILAALLLLAYPVVEDEPDAIAALSQ